MATSGEERNALTILWRIENLSYFQRGFHGDGIRIPEFHCRILGDSGTQLWFFPLGKGEGDNNVYLRLCTSNLTLAPFPIDCELSLLAWDGSPHVTRKEIRLARSSKVFELSDSPTREELFVTKKSTFLLHDTLTVRCRLWKSDGNFLHAELISARTRIEFAEGSIYWPIGGFRGVILKHNNDFSHQLRFIHGRVEFLLKCSLTDRSLQESDLNIEVTISQMLREYFVKLEVSVWSNGQEVLKLNGKEKSFSVSKAKNTWIVPKFPLRENLRGKISQLKDSECLSLTFRLTAVIKDISECIEKTYFGLSNMEQETTTTTTIASEAKSQSLKKSGSTSALERIVSNFSEANNKTSEQRSYTPSELQQRNDCLAILGEDLFSLYQKQTFSDFELRTGNFFFPVHKMVLSARSPVFSSMFSTEVEESNSLNIPDLDALALKRMLTFMYKGTVETDLTLENAAKLYDAADKYEIDSLKRQCSNILQSQISVSNVSDILAIADGHQDSDLTSFVQNFILSHYDDVMYSEEWENFLDINPILAGKSMHLLYKKKASKRQKLR